MCVRESSPTVGFSPTSPLRLDGQVTEPSVSVPMAAADREAATATALPDDEPQAERSSANGLRVRPADAAPSADRAAAAHVRPFGQVGLAEDDGARRAQPRDHGGVASGEVAQQRQRSGGGGHRVGGVDIVLDQDRHAFERPGTLAGAPPVAVPGLRHRIGVDGQDRLQRRAGMIETADAIEVDTHQLFGRHTTGCHVAFEVADGPAFDVVGWGTGGGGNGGRGFGHDKAPEEDGWRKCQPGHDGSDIAVFPEKHRPDPLKKETGPALLDRPRKGSARAG